MKLLHFYALPTFCLFLLFPSRAPCQQPHATSSNEGTEPSKALKWTRHDTVDRMTGQSSSRLSALYPDDGGFKLNATCENAADLMQAVQLTIEPMDPKLKYPLRYVPPTEDITLYQYVPNGVITGTGRLHEGYYTATPRIRIDDRMVTVGGGSAHQIDFAFVTPYDSKRTEAALASKLDVKITPPARRTQDDENRERLFKALDGLYNRKASALGIYMIPDLSQGQKALIEQVFENGPAVYITLDLQDSTFHEFVNKCGGIVPKPPPAQVEVPAWAKPPGGGGGINNPNLKEPTIPLAHPAKFEGSLKEFQAAIPTLMQQAAVKWKMPEHSLDAETGWIEKIAAKCSSLTPGVVSALSLTDQEQLKRGGGGFPKWAACGGGWLPVTQLVREYDRPTERGVVYRIAPVGSWGNAHAVEMLILFTSLPGDNVAENFFAYYGIVDATIRAENNGQAETPIDVMGPMINRAMRKAQN